MQGAASAGRCCEVAHGSAIIIRMTRGLMHLLDRGLREPAQRPHGGRHAPRMFRPLPALIVVSVCAMVGGWLIFAGLARLIDPRVPWWPEAGSIPRGILFDVTRSAATVAALIGGLFAILYAFRKQRVEEASGHRADAQALSERYQGSAEQLGHEKPAVRLAGVYAMARLADEWPEQRQTCVDVLCAYLRLPWEVGPEDPQGYQFDPDFQVRKSILSILEDRYARTASISWSDQSLDLSGAVLPSFAFRGTAFNRHVSLDGVKFTGPFHFWDVHIGGQIFCRGAIIEKQFEMRKVRIADGSMLNISGMRIDEGARVDLQFDHVGFRDDDTAVLAIGLRVSGTLSIDVRPSGARQGEVHLHKAKLLEDSAAFVIDAHAGESALTVDRWPTVCLSGDTTKPPRQTDHHPAAFAR